MPIHMTESMVADLAEKQAAGIKEVVFYYAAAETVGGIAEGLAEKFWDARRVKKVRFVNWDPHRGVWTNKRR